MTGVPWPAGDHGHGLCCSDCSLLIPRYHLQSQVSVTERRVSSHRDYCNDSGYLVQLTTTLTFTPHILYTRLVAFLTGASPLLHGSLSGILTYLHVCKKLVCRSKRKT